MKGARLGMLPPEYGEKGSRVLDGIRDTYLKKGEQGWELHGICASAGLGQGPDNRTDRTGTPEYYLSEKQMVDNQHRCRRLHDGGQRAAAPCIRV